MNTWNVKDMSKRANVSIRTLHYYDKIGLLKPSARLSNGYRVYREKDLTKLEQIIALKFCGFPLIHIRRFIEERNDEETLALLKSQLKLLHDEVSHIQEAQMLLDKVIDELEKTKSVNWQSMIEFIREYGHTGLTTHASFSEYSKHKKDYRSENL